MSFDCASIDKPIMPSSKARSVKSSPTDKSRQHVDSDVEDYHHKRERNNVSVKKSRQKSRSRAREMKGRVEKLRVENADLEHKVALLSKELGLLKELFIAHAGGTSDGHCSLTNIPTASVKCDVDENIVSVMVNKDHGYSAPTEKR